MKHCEKRLPLKWRSFRERSHFPRIWFPDLRIRFWGFKFKHLNAHNFVWQGCFFFHSYIATSTTIWAQIFTGLFYAYVEIHQVWEDWSLTITNSVQCLYSQKKQNKLRLKSRFLPPFPVFSTYDVCSAMDHLESSYGCPSEFTAAGLPCRCPFTPG